MNEVYLGKYCQYKGDRFLIVEDRDSKLLIISLEKKLQILKDNAVILPFKPAKTVTYKSAEYLVTRFGAIISLATHKFMNWDAKNGNRKAILALAEEVQ